MIQENSVVMVSGSGEVALPLRRALHDAGVSVRVVRSCAETEEILNGLSVPSMLFCETSLPDGTWADILALASEAQTRIPVVVVSRLVDIDLYINALEHGAADFIVPPFCQKDVSYVMSCAVQKNMAVQSPGAA
ncbi:MAG: response regulator [Acidobacteria bacterium]|nr:MAG: response regulator [Acidobacteriota bacterium]